MDGRDIEDKTLTCISDENPDRCKRIEEKLNDLDKKLKLALRMIQENKEKLNMNISFKGDSSSTLGKVNGVFKNEKSDEDPNPGRTFHLFIYASKHISSINNFWLP